jgi:hypothetical protein
VDPADLGLDVDRIPICQACLSFVSMSLTDPKEARHWTFQMTPQLWEEGLREPALEAVRKLGDRAALADLEAKGGRSATARGIVLHLAQQQEERSRRRYQALLSR